ncbi:hypothetical protein [Pseudomonas cremoricolorata]|uniref:hypothetical protein n=1 Tax=Pseudomonas cremoricolorata TaxID=157783 RepID=UPI00041A7A71|nr:hypothetical protein [Pseudomonas cremoricolorata]
MAKYVFKPEKSFIARVYWHGPARTERELDSSNWQRVYVTYDQALLGNRGWLHIGHVLPNPELEHYSSNGVGAVQFWFGCYQGGEDYRFEIRTADLEDGHPYWNHSNCRLDISRNGYLGVYGVSEKPGHDFEANGTMTWRLPGLEPTRLSVDTPQGGLDLLTPDSKCITRLDEDDFPYLSTRAGQRSWLGLKLIKMGVAHP